MTHKYERQCWNCGGRDMEDMGTHVKCRKCGATWNEIAQLGGPVVEPGNVLLATSSGDISMQAKHPTAGVRRRAARARSKQ